MNIYQLILLFVALIAIIVVSWIYIYISFKENKILNLRNKEFELRVCILESEFETLKDVVYNENSK